MATQHDYDWKSGNICHAATKPNDNAKFAARGIIRKEIDLAQLQSLFLRTNYLVTDD
jgi:hypothetical protein